MKEIDEFFQPFTHLVYKKGERILRENETPSGVFYLKKGIVRSYFISEEGNELTIIMREPGTIFPLRWALAEQPNIYNYQAMKDSEILRAPAEAFKKFVKNDLEVMNAVNNQLINDFNALAYRLQHIVFGNAYSKVASVVLTAAKRFGTSNKANKSVTVDVPLTHQQIAESAGVTRETASLEMKKLKTDKIINYSGRTLTVIDMEQLAKVSYL